MNFKAEPYLKEVIDLYKKVQDFGSAVRLKYEYNLEEDAYCHYIKEDIDAVMDAFTSSFKLTTEESGPLKDALRSGEIDFIKLRITEELLKGEQFPLLYILCRPFFQSMKNLFDDEDIHWKEGKCPVCNAVPSLSVIEEDAPRKCFCSYCGSTGNYKRIGCPFCKNENSEKINIMYFKDTDDIRIDACNVCKSYVKTFLGMPSDRTIEEMDIMSLAFDIVAQNKGFHRRSPNAVGILRIK